MKLTKVLYRQHIDRMFKAHWRVQGKRVPIDTKATQILASKGIPLYDPKELVQEKREKLWYFHVRQYLLNYDSYLNISGLI